MKKIKARTEIYCFFIPLFSSNSSEKLLIITCDLAVQVTHLCKGTIVVNTSRSFPHSWFLTRFATRLTWWVPLVEQELLTLPEHMSSPPVFSEVRVTRSFVLCVCFVDRCLFFCTFSFDHCFVCFSSIYKFWLPLWYLQLFLLFKMESWSNICENYFGVVL